MSSHPPDEGTTSPPAVVVAGDALVDLTPTASVRGVPAYEPHPGGSCLNVSVGLARLGVPTALLARISEDHWGELLRSHLVASGVRTTHLLATEDPTTLAAVHLESGGPSYSFHSAGAADRGLEPRHLADLPDAGRLPDGAALHVGSIALTQEPQASTLDGLMRREAGRRLLSLDPNVRPGLVGDRAAYLRRMSDWVSMADVVKASDEDIAWLYPGETQESVVERWLAAGAALVLVTLGPHGAWAATRAVRRRVDAPKVAVVDTVGAGDAFTAGVLAHLQAADRMHRAGVEAMTADQLGALLADAVRIAADTCTRSGAEPPYRRDLAGAGTAPETWHTSMEELVERARELAARGGRHILGITGPPGAGKTTVAEAVVEALGPDLAVVVPMDGFHYSNATLRDLGRRDRKGAWDTFDADGYVNLLRRLRSGDQAVVYVPLFDRDIDESIGSARPVPREVPLVVTEGNYLLSPRGAWGQVSSLLDESWYVELDESTRLERLTARHERHGMGPDAASAWARGTDQVNADQVAADRARADRVVRLEPRSDR